LRRHYPKNYQKSDKLPQNYRCSKSAGLLRVIAADSLGKHVEFTSKQSLFTIQALTSILFSVLDKIETYYFKGVI